MNTSTATATIFDELRQGFYRLAGSEVVLQAGVVATPRGKHRRLTRVERIALQQQCVEARNSIERWGQSARQRVDAGSYDVADQLAGSAHTASLYELRTAIEALTGTN